MWPVYFIFKIKGNFSIEIKVKSWGYLLASDSFDNQMPW
jgi:hypothetical protein